MQWRAAKLCHTTSLGPTPPLRFCLLRNQPCLTLPKQPTSPILRKLASCEARTGLGVELRSSTKSLESLLDGGSPRFFAALVPRFKRYKAQDKVIAKTLSDALQKPTL